MAIRRGSERQVGGIVRRPHPSRYRDRGLDRAIDGVRERPSVLLDQFERAARLRVRVGAAAGHEKRRGAVTSRFQERLRHAGVIAMELAEVALQRRVVACIAEDDGQRGAGLPIDAKHGYRMIHGSVRRELHAPVRRERRRALTDAQAHRLEPPHRRSDDGQRFLFQRARVVADDGALLRRQVVRDRQHLAGHRAAVRMARVQQERCARQAMATPNRRRDPIGHGRVHTQQVERDQHDAPAAACGCCL